MSDSPSESVAQSIVLIVNSIFAVVESTGGVHDLLLLGSKHLALAQRPVPSEHVKNVGVHIVVTVQTIKGNHFSVLGGVNIGNPFIVFEYRRTGVVLERNAVPADMTTAGGGHPGRLKDVLLQKFLERNAGEPLHKQSQQVIAGIGVTQSFPRCEVWFRFGFKEKTEDFVVARDPFFFLPDFYKPVRIVKIVGNSAGVVQKMPDSYALIRSKFRKIH